MNVNRRTEEQQALPSGWRWARIGEVANIFAGSAAPQDPKYFETSGQPFIRVSDIGGGRRIRNLTLSRDHLSPLAVSTLPLVKAKKGTILFPKSGAAISTNSRAIMGFDAYIVSHLMAVSPGANLMSDWIFWWLSQIDMMSFSDNTAYPSLKQSVVEKINIPLPPLPEQMRIAAILNEQMAAIEGARAAADAQLAAAKALPAAYLRRVFPRERQELPPGWRWAKLGEVSTLNPRRPDICRRDNELTTFIPMSAVDDKKGIVSNSEMRPYAEIKKGYTYFAEGDVLFAKITPCMQNGKHAIARGLLDAVGFGSTEFHIIRPISEVASEWIHYFIRQPHILHEAINFFKGAVGQQRVPESFLYNLEISLPTLAEQKRIAAVLSEQMAAAEQLRADLEKQLNKINALPAALLKRAFNGEF